MEAYPYTRQIKFDAVNNFRDLGGYRTSKGYTTAWRKLFRSGELHRMTNNDLKKLKDLVAVSSVMDLRSHYEIDMQGTGILADAGFRHFNVSLITDGGKGQANTERYAGFTDMGQFYFSLVQNKEFGRLLIRALEIIAEPSNQPLIFHCSAGKDRTGILAAILLSTMDVVEEDIVDDYCLTEQYMEVLLNYIKSNPQLAADAESLPDYFWKVSPRSMWLFLISIRKMYGSVRGYLQMVGANASLFARLEKTLLT
jgi:protein-tyrosine phosphatase